VLTRIVASEVANGVAEALTRAQTDREPRREAIRTSRLKMENPEKFDGKNSMAFNQWWKSVTMYLGFYPETTDRQKIACIGTLLADTTLVWHLHRYRELQDNNTWANYSAAIRTEYQNEQEAADAQLKLGQLKYQGSIRVYLTEFRVLNNFACATGEALREKVDLAMPDAVLDMRFAHYLEDFADDEVFLQATHQVGLQVEKKKALKAAKEARQSGATPNRDGTKNDRPKEHGKKNNTRPNPKEGAPEPRPSNTRPPKKDSWPLQEVALKGVPSKEAEEYRKNWEDCWRCGRPGHRTYNCFSFQKVQGTALPPAPWKVAAVETTKRKRENETEEPLTAKQQKVAAVEAMTTDLPLWTDSEDLDF